MQYELMVILLVGVPTLILWAISTVLGWNGGKGPGFWVTLLEIVAIGVTIYMPLIGSFFFDRMTKKRKMKRSSDSFSHASNQSLEDEFQFVLFDEMLNQHFEKYEIFLYQTTTTTPRRHPS